jgi:hypothetical protein
MWSMRSRLTLPIEGGLQSFDGLRWANTGLHPSPSPYQRCRHLGPHPLHGANPHAGVRAKVVRRGQSIIFQIAVVMLPRDLLAYVLALIA